MNFIDNDYFKGIYRIETARLKNWDYSSDGAYFITICTKNMVECFGEIRNGVMGLNELGCAAATFWQEIPEHFAHVILDEWVIMPNHVHGVIINNNTYRRDAINRVSTNGNTYGGITGNKNPMHTMSLGRIVRWFKGKTTFKIRKNINPDFTWQTRFYDRVIRHENELNRIREYIRQNPSKWEWDRNNKNVLI